MAIHWKKCAKHLKTLRVSVDNIVAFQCCGASCDREKKEIRIDSMAEYTEVRCADGHSHRIRIVDRRKGTITIELNVPEEKVSRLVGVESL